ncbi:hypothetical protein Tco_1101593 [Tanacetum coccineum]
MTQAAIRQLIADGIAAALEAQAATMANTNRNVISNYKGFMSCQPSYFNGYESQGKWKVKFYILECKENDLKTYVRGFQELAVLCQKHWYHTRGCLWKSLSGDYPEVLKENVNASKLSTMEESHYHLTRS